jgi:hypothetical protein
MAETNHENGHGNENESEERSSKRKRSEIEANSAEDVAGDDSEVDEDIPTKKRKVSKRFMGCTVALSFDKEPAN